MNTKEMTASLVRDLLESHPPSRLIRWVMVLFLLFCGIPQKTVAATTNYTERQVRNIRDRFENSNGDFPREGKKRGLAGSRCTKKRAKTGERPFGNWRQPLNTRNQAMLNTPCIVHNPPYSYASSFLLHAIPPQLSHISDASFPERAASHSPASSLV